MLGIKNIKYFSVHVLPLEQNAYMVSMNCAFPIISHSFDVSLRNLIQNASVLRHGVSHNTLEELEIGTTNG